jgi:hypothetical protein
MQAGQRVDFLRISFPLPSLQQQLICGAVLSASVAFPQSTASMLSDRRGGNWLTVFQLQEDE